MQNSLPFLPFLLFWGSPLFSTNQAKKRFLFVVAGVLVPGKRCQVWMLFEFADRGRGLQGRCCSSSHGFPLGALTRSPSNWCPTSHRFFFGWEASPLKVDYREKKSGTLIPLTWPPFHVAMAPDREVVKRKLIFQVPSAKCHGNVGGTVACCFMFC